MPVVNKVIAFTLTSFLCFQVASDETIGRIHRVLDQWGCCIKDFDTAIFIADIDRTLYQGPELDEVLKGACSLYGSISYRTYFYQQFINRILSHENCFVIYSTARSHLPFIKGKSVNQRYEAYANGLEIEREIIDGYQSEIISLGIDLNESPDFAQETFDYTGEWLLLRRPSRRPAFLPKCHALITGSGSFIQVDTKLGSRIKPEQYNKIVSQWIKEDGTCIQDINVDWLLSYGTLMQRTNVGCYATLPLPENPVNQPFICSRLQPECLLVWPEIQPGDSGISVQNLSINKGYAVIWLLIEMEKAGFIKQLGNNAIIVCGDSEGDRAMLRLDLAGLALKPWALCSYEQKSLLKGRLAELEMTFEVPEWICNSWVGSVLPRGHTLRPDLLKHCDKIMAVKPVPDSASSSGLLSMLELVVEILQTNCNAAISKALGIKPGDPIPAWLRDYMQSLRTSHNK